MNKQKLKKEFLKYVHKGDSTVSPSHLVDCCMILTEQYTDAQTALLRKENNDLIECLKSIVGCTRQQGTSGRNRLNDNKLGMFHISIERAKNFLKT